MCACGWAVGLAGGRAAGRAVVLGRGGGLCRCGRAGYIVLWLCSVSRGLVVVLVVVVVVAVLERYNKMKLSKKLHHFNNEII